MRSLLFSVLLGVFVLARAAPGQDAPRSELDGKWTAISLVTIDGKEDNDYARTIHWTIMGDKLTHQEKLVTVRTTIRVDSTKRPKTFDVEVKEGFVTIAWAGIYELDGDTLKVCYVTEKNVERPKDFKAKSAILLVLKRDKQ
jgi:uncharacterized protein (TIGR03067 family)